jgi:hypothetical protein
MSYLGIEPREAWSQSDGLPAQGIPGFITQITNKPMRCLLFLFPALDFLEYIPPLRNCGDV